MASSDAKARSLREVSPSPGAHCATHDNSRYLRTVSDAGRARGRTRIKKVARPLLALAGDGGHDTGHGESGADGEGRRQETKSET